MSNQKSKSASVNEVSNSVEVKGIGAVEVSNSVEVGNIVVSSATKEWVVVRRDADFLFQRIYRALESRECEADRLFKSRYEGILVELVRLIEEDLKEEVIENIGSLSNNYSVL